MKDLFEALPDPVSDDLAVREGEVRGGGHGPEIGLALGGGQGNAGQLAVRENDSVARERAVAYLQVVIADLMSQTPGPAVN